MDITFHTLPNLFVQLGLDSDPDSIESFIQNHRIAHDEKLEEAAYWSPSQSAFLQECLQLDSDWVEVVDQLNVRIQAKY